MSVLALLHDLAAKKIRVWLDGDQLRFKAPKGAMTASLRKRLKSEKEAVIAHLAKDLSVRQAEAAIPVADRSQPLPLSYAQQRLWFIDLLDPGNPTYNISFADDVMGHLDLVMLEQAFADLLARHESLRTRFPNQDGKPIQLVEPKLEPHIQFFDFSHFQKAAQKEAVVDLVGAFARQPFCLGEGPLFRLALCRLSSDHHVLAVALHHIVADGWSLGVFLSEWGTLYSQRLKKAEASLEPLAIQYADFAVWQRAFLDEGAMVKQTEFWQEQLAQPRADSQLPTDFPRPKKLSHKGALHFFSIDKQIFANLRRYREDDGATPFMTFLTAYMVLLYRLSGQKDLLIGTPVAQRDRAELEQLIGFLVNTVIIRGDLSKKLTFEELHRQIQATTLRSFAHADVPFEKLVEVLQPERDPSRNPLMQVMFSMHNHERKALELPGLTLTPFTYEAAVAHFDLSLGLEIHGDELLGYFEYSTDLFQATFIERMTTAFERLLAGMAADTNLKIDEYELLGEAEVQHLSEGWRSSQAFGADGLVKKFSDAVEVHAEQPAIRREAQMLTYAELDQQTDQIALALEKNGVAPDLRVLVAIPDAYESLLALVALAKLGAVAVPVMPNWPTRTIAAAIKSISPVVCLGTDLHKSFPDGAWLALSELQKEDHKESFVAKINQGQAMLICLEPDAFGLVHGGEISTSQLLNACEAWSQNGITQGNKTQVLSQTASFATISCWWASLLAGGELMIPSSAESLNENLHEAQMQGAHVAVCDLGQAQDLSQTDTMKQGGFEQLMVVGDGLALTTLGNMFDGSALGTWRFVYAQPHGNSLAISPPRQASTDLIDAWILNRSQTPEWQIQTPSGQRAPQGVPGEITLEEGRRTGEKGRILSDGCPKLLGRVDRSVRFGAFNLDLGQMETMLKLHQDIQRAHIGLVQNQSGKAMLATWFEAHGSPEPEPQELMAFLRPNVVDACIPALWQKVDRLPFDHEGDILPDALPPIEMMEQGDEVVDQDPATPHEWLMAMIWADVIGVKQVRRNDHFFKMGGHSLMAVLVLAKVGELFDERVPMRALFENPTLSGFTAQLQKVQAA